MSRGADQRVADILDAIDRCRRYIGALQDDDANLVDMAGDAIERNLQIIGEAANHLPAEITEAHPEIAWPQIRGFRHSLVHQYFGVDAENRPRRHRDSSPAVGRGAVRVRCEPNAPRGFQKPIPTGSEALTRPALQAKSRHRWQTNMTHSGLAIRYRVEWCGSARPSGSPVSRAHLL